MRVLETIRRQLAVADDPELVRAQAQALSGQVPLLYGMLLVNSILLAGSHYGSAPDLLTVGVPLGLLAACAARLIFWWRGRRRELSYGEARFMLRGMVPIAGMLAIGFTSWSLSLYPYGGPFQQAHVAFYMGITTIACMFCIASVRAAALMVGVCVLVPFIVFFAFSGNLILGAMALNMLLVIAVLIVILTRTASHFEQLVSSRNTILREKVAVQRLSDENQRLASTDSLTGLINRRSFDHELALALVRSEQEGRSVATARINLDGFKAVNDVFGQITGDRVLQEAGSRILAVCPPSTRVARLVSDNFALILTEDVSSEALQALGRRLTESLRRPYVEKLGTVHLSATVGMAVSQPGDSAFSLYDRADYVTWVAKREARGEALVFSAVDAAELTKVRRMEHALLTAELDAEINILFQPQFDVGANRTIGYEVLARWQSPELGAVSPADFIPMAERLGIITKITQTVLRKAIAASARLPKDIRLSVNLSAHDVGSMTAIETIVRQVQHGGEQCRIDFEITETAVMRDLRQASAALDTLSRLGCRIALDDFGTGHSSLTHVQRLPLDRIKIDRSFVAEVTTDPTSRAIIKTMVELCRNLGLTCVFEGIETPEQLDALLTLGGTIMQGYLFGRPMSEADALESLYPKPFSSGQRRRTAAG